MSTPKPVYSRPSDEDTAPAPKKRKRHRARGRHRKGLRPTEAPTATTAAKGVITTDTLQDDDSVTNRYPVRGDGVTKRDPTTTGDRHKRNRRTHEREKRRLRDLRAENERLHRRLAAIYDALNLD